MSKETNEISSAYRNSRRNTSILCGIGIAWAAAQFELKTLFLGTLGDVNIERASIPILIAILCIYTMTRCTIEFMMQPKPVRRWPLAQLDYRITLYLVRFTLVVLTAGAIARTIEMVAYIAGTFLLAAVGFFLFSFVLMLIVMPVRLCVGKLFGRNSVASAAIESVFYSFKLSGLVLIVLIALVGLDIINPIGYLGESYKDFNGIPLAIFSSVCLVMLLSFFFDQIFLKMVFAFEPIMIERKYYEDGKEIISIEPNPNHPFYEEHKAKSALKFTKTKPEEKSKDKPDAKQ